MKKDKINMIIKIVLIVIIIILLIHNCSLLSLIKDNNKKKKTPTGNVDIFEIICEKDTCEVDDNDLNVTSINGIDNTNRTKPASKTDDDKQDEGEGFIISDKDIIWSSTNKLRIFSNPVYDMNSKIAPGDSNIYQFVIKNNTKNNIKYNITFKENNTYNMNMKYRLKKGNIYVAGNTDYVSYNELNQNNIKINSNESHTYYLEWKWLGTDNDNSLSGIDNAYDIIIKIEAESINE